MIIKSSSRFWWFWWWWRWSSTWSIWCGYCKLTACSVSGCWILGRCWAISRNRRISEGCAWASFRLVGLRWWPHDRRWTCYSLPLFSGPWFYSMHRSALRGRNFSSQVKEVSVQYSVVLFHLHFHRLNLAELTRSEKDVLLLGIICTSINAGPETMRGGGKKNVSRDKTRIRQFHFEHHQLCRDGFCFLFEVSRQTLTNLKKHYLENGFVPRKIKSGELNNTIDIRIWLLNN